MKIISGVKYLTAGMLLATFGLSWATIPNGYYDSLDGLSGVSLKKAVKNVAKNHTAISYGNETWTVFLESDTRSVNGRRCWWDMYSDNNVTAPNASSHSGMNIEHGVPNSWWGKTQNNAYKDLFHLNPSDADANNRKGNYPLAEIVNQTWTNGVTTVGHPKSGMGDNAHLVFEPADEYKGDFARAYFYMFTIYDDIAWTNSWNWMYNTSSDLLLKPWAYEMLLKWAKNDPVSQKEIDRNEVIYKHQKNRNPFIDYPELAEHIWGSKKNTPFHLDGSSPGVDPDPDPDDPVITPDDPSDVPAGYWYAVTTAADLNEDYKYVIVSTENHVAMSVNASSNNSGSAGYFLPCGKNPGFDNSQTPARLSSVPDDVAVITLSKNGTSWLMAVSDLNGSHQGYITSSATKVVGLNYSGTPASITPGSSSTNIKFGNVAGNLQYNNQDNAKRFTSYTSVQESIMLYRLEEEKKGDTTGLGTGLHENADEVIYGIFDINGRKMSAESISELENGIYIVISNFGTKKIMK